MINFRNVQYDRSYGTSAQLPESTLPEIAFAGRSNVGKSSLLNKLVGQKNLARVSQKPGKTATINFFTAGDATPDKRSDIPPQRHHAFRLRTRSDLCRRCTSDNKLCQRR